MTIGIGAVAAAPANAEDRLRQASRRLEGVFVEQMMKAMRQTVSQDGIVSGGTGEELFTSLFDQHIADTMPGQWKHGLSSAVYSQLQGSADQDGKVVR